MGEVFIKEPLFVFGGFRIEGVTEDGEGGLVDLGDEVDEFSFEGFLVSSGTGVVEFAPAKVHVGKSRDKANVEFEVRIRFRVFTEVRFDGEVDFFSASGVFEVIEEFGVGVGTAPIVLVVWFLGPHRGCDGEGFF